jgi:hypothetical protein
MEEEWNQGGREKLRNGLPQRTSCPGLLLVQNTKLLVAFLSAEILVVVLK